MTAPIIELRDVSFTYLHGERPALKKIDLRIERGEMIALMGPLGAGKTTLLHSFNSIVPHQFPGVLKGDVVVEGMNTRKHEPVELSKYVGLVVDDPRLQVFNLTVEDDVEFGPLNLGLPFDEVENRKNYALDALRLRGLEGKHPKELSGGQQQRVALAGALAMRPKVIALDEPISMLDPVGKSEVLSAIRELNERHKVACVIAESGADIEDVISFATRALVMADGKILLDDKPSKVLESGLLEDLGVGIPQVADLFIKIHRRLGADLPLPISVEEATGYILKFLKGGKISVKKVGAPRDEYPVRGRRPKEKVTLLSANNVWYTYPDGTEALRGVSLGLHRGEMVAFIGQNGSGKSTLALNLVGAYKPTNPDARITIGGLDVAKMDTNKLIRKINYVFQNPDVQLFNPTVREEVMFALKMLEESPASIKRKVSETLKLLGLVEHADRPIVDLTVDMKTLVAIASIVVLRPEILIIDEPTSGLDRKSSAKLMKVLRGLRDEGHTVVIITHDMKLVYEFCDRAVVMKDGYLLLDGTPTQVFSKVDVLRETFIKSPQVTQLAYNLSKHDFPIDICTVDGFMDRIQIRGG